jgi:hypothetical protein
MSNNFAVKDASGTSRTIKTTDNSDVHTTHHLVDLPGTAWRYVAASGGITDTGAVSLVGAQAAGVKNYCTGIQFINTDATVGTELAITDGVGGTVLWRGFAPASIAAVTQPSMVSITFNPPIVGTAATILAAVCITNSSQTYVNAQGYSL